MEDVLSNLQFCYTMLSKDENVAETLRMTLNLPLRAEKQRMMNN